MRPDAPPDARIQRALTREPSPGLAGDLFADIAVALERTPQVRSWRIGWPMRGAMPVVGESAARRRLGTAGLVLVTLLALLVSIAVVGLIGGRRHPLPAGLARPGLIAFDSAGDIFVSPADGTPPRPLTTGPNDDIEAVFSPDGTQIAYLSLVAGTSQVRLNVVAADATTQPPTVVVELAASGRNGGPQVPFIHIAWSPDSTRIAYTAMAGGHPQLFVASMDGVSPVPIGPSDIEGESPVWSPDGLQIAFKGGHFNLDRGIYVMNADGTGAPLRLTPPSRAQVTPDVMFSAPAWSLDGALVAYSSMVDDGGSHVFVVSSRGGDPQDVSGPPGFSGWSPAWSPDGEWLAWRAGGDGVPGQFVVARPDGTDRSILPPAVGGAPVWSPDGRHLIGSSNNVATGTTDRLIVIDVVHGTWSEIPAELAGDPSWQRLAR